MKEIDDTNINLDALFEGKPYHMLDAETQAYVLKEFGSVEEYETMSSSFKRIRSVITEEEDITADARVKNELLALFDKDEDRKIVPLIPKATGLSFLKSPYFQIAAAASVVLVALFFIPWDGNNTSDQLALANAKKEKGETIVLDESPAESTGQTTTNGLNWKEAKGNQGPVADALTSKDASVFERSTNDSSVGYAGLRDTDGGTTVTETSKMSEEEVIELSAAEQEKDEKDRSETKNITHNKSVNKEAEGDTRKKSDDGSLSKTETKSKKLERQNLETSKRNDKNAKLARNESENKQLNEGTAVMAPSSVTVDDNLKDKTKKPVNGISLSEEKDLMQFFNTAL